MSMSKTSGSENARHRSWISNGLRMALSPVLAAALTPLASGAPRPSSPSAAPSGTAVPSGWLEQAQSDLQEREYDVSWQAVPGAEGIAPSWQAPNRAQGFRTHFTPEGI